MKVKDLLKGVEYFCKDKSLLEYEVADISFDNRDIKGNSIFVAYKGVSYDTHNDIDKLINDSRIKVLVTEKEFDFPTIVVKNGRRALSLISKNFFIEDYEPNYIGVTGTNGKTTTAYLIDHILEFTGYKTARFGTINYKIDKELYPSTTTTPSTYEFYKMLGVAEKANCEFVVMEVSSHALDQDRVYGINFNYAIYTNLSGDHLDYHKDLDDYFNSKSKLFTEYLNGCGVVNVDDEYGKKLLYLIKDNEILTYSFNNNKANCFVDRFDMDLDKTEIVLNLLGEKIHFETSLVGKHNIYNLMAAILTAHHLGIDHNSITRAIKTFSNVPGRLEKLIYNNIYIFIDYAHTDDALENVLSSLKPFRKRRLITLFGCGGDRDKSKRPRMAKVAEKYSDLVVVTSDNPRNEDPEKIIDDILQGFGDKSKVVVEPDRREAIKLALKEAEPEDIVLIAGKGHEDYQLIKGVKYHFDDKEEVINFFEGK